MTLSPEELYRFDLAGFCVVKGALEPDLVLRLEQKLRALEGLDRDELPRHALPAWTPVVDEYRLLNIVECDAVFRELIDHPQLMRWVDEVVPAPQRLTQAFSITRRRGVGLPLHALPIAHYDASTGRPRSDFVTCMIPLTSVGADDGPFVAFEGSHKLRVPFPYGLVHPEWQVPGVDAAYFERSLAKEEGRNRVPWEEIPGYREVTVVPGDVIVMTEDLVHGAKAIHSERVRRSLYFSYSPLHFPNWHGVDYSEELMESVGERARSLLAGPYLGHLLAGSRPSGVRPSEFVPRLEHSERDPNRFRASADPLAPRDGLADARERIETTTRRNRPVLDPAREMRGACQLNLTDVPGQRLQFVLDDDCGFVRGGEFEPCCSIETRSAVLFRLAERGVDPVELFYRGELAIRGDLRWAMRLADLWTAEVGP